MNADTLKDLSTKISQYFLEFLESDFKRQQAPKRRVVLQTENGFKSGMRVAPYVALQRDLWELLNRPISDELKFQFKPKKYTKQLSNVLKLVIKEQVNTITQASVEIIITELVNQAKQSYHKAISHPEDWVETLRIALLNEISSNLVRPVLTLIDEALSKNAYSQADSIFNAESDLLERIAAPLEEILPEVLARLAAKEDYAELQQTSHDRLDLDFIKTCLLEYFENFASADGFLEFRDINTFATTAEGVQLYLYVGTIKYGSSNYPIFYLPLDCIYDDSIKGYKIEISSHIYANKRAFDFILQELEARQARQILSPIKERISYAQPNQTVVEVIAPLVTRLQTAFGLLGDMRLQDGPSQQIADTTVAINNALYICAFEKSDEALLNDYEEMINQAQQNKDGVIDLFQGMISGILTENPLSIEREIDALWNELPVEERVVPDCPLPLNEEQVKIINAISHSSGKFIVVEGPPGTGKSHTIVAIAADCAFKNKSCLILSDKKEALEVVQKKLSKTMNDARGDQSFPNPLLRLGTEQANFRTLTSQQVFTQVKAHSRVTEAGSNSITQERDRRRTKLKSNINQIIKTFGNIKTSDILNAQRLADRLATDGDENLPTLIEQLHDERPEISLSNIAYASDVFQSQVLSIFQSKKNWSASELLAELCTHNFVAQTSESFDLSVSDLCASIDPDGVNELGDILSEFRQLKIPVLGYLFRGKRVLALSAKAQRTGTYKKQIDLRKDQKSIEKLISEMRFLIASTQEVPDLAISSQRAYALLIKTPAVSTGFSDLYILLRELCVVADERQLARLLNNSNPDVLARLWIQVLEYYKLIRSIKSSFNDAPTFDYVGEKTEVERLNTTLMNAEVDGRLVRFMQEFKADSKVLAKLIKDRQKFPEEQFENVKTAFPIIVASIREFGEFMPLKNDLFDVLVIDEASQVSVAQAFPALLRAKKVVVMGDSKQFSNTKSMNASISLNNKYRSELTSFFKRSVSADAAILERLSYFDVKRSVLEFCQMSANYSIMLRKHFRSYQELISYSSKQFYGGQLQAIKIRGVPVEDVIEFSILEGDIEATRSTNKSEALFILEQCLGLLEAKSPPTVGIITPFREQQTLISKLLSGHSRYQEFLNKLQLKVMTFDSCQGEERNIIFYSMVATKNSDTLNYIFPVSLQDAQEQVAEKLKIQRLNVGFSRAQEMVWFVLSKPLDEFNGSIGQALRHFQLTLNSSNPGNDQTDQNSPMESKVLNWLYASEFFQFHEEELEVLPQFPIGDYLRQLDPSYKHPAYKVDFLLTFSSEKGIVHIIIEYDGFEFHFKRDSDIDVGNHERYLTDSDVERQLILESYGYKFLRINRFNLGKDPVQTISDRLYRLIELHFSDNTNDVVRSVQAQANALLDRSAKQCQICKKIKPHIDYFDQKLKDGAGGYGRHCMTCKNSALKEAGSRTKKPRQRRWH